MARRSPSRQPPPSAGLPPAFVAIAVILIAAVGVVFVVSQMKPPPEEAQAAPAKVDPFADMPPEVPPGGAPRPADAGRVADRSDPFADLTGIEEAELWQQALEVGKAGMDLVEQAGAAKAAGDLAGFKTLGAQAKEKLNQAVETTRDWAHALEAEHGADHRDVKRIERTRKIWRNQLVAMKKTVGF
jgi:hypothetical protein